MSRGDINSIRRHAREKALYHYGRALDCGDFETVAAVLKEAESDSELERMIIEINQVFRVEYEESARDDDAEVVRQLAHKHLPSGLESDIEVAELPPLTVADVAVRIKSDAARSGRTTRDVMTTAERLTASHAPLPETLNQAAVRQLLDRLGVPVSTTFLKVFRDTAIFLAMGREHGNARLAAARRERGLTGAKGRPASSKKQEA